MPFILLWVGLALLRGFIDYGSSLSFRGWFITELIIDPILTGLLYSSATVHENPYAPARKSAPLVQRSHHLYSLPAVHYLHSR
ncbi:hypothetical protein [Citrobacter farmeri]|uniref:hypothetical protein n=1 Tax=Citrobacter farmeri TaxID=67824 RepID=UPI00300C7CC2